MKSTLTLKIATYNIELFSNYLQRNVIVDFYIPTTIIDSKNLPLLFINDGQDLPKFDFATMLNDMVNSEIIEPLAVVAIHCGDDRINEYGTACITDYKGRGKKAALYTQFIFDELLPYTRQKFNLHFVREKAFCGFSLGGLSALDIVWNYAREFDKVGCFSGSLWWRTSDIENNYIEDLDKIMHQQIRAGEYRKWLKFYFECGTADETEDRNGNGVIDSIDDTMELIDELVKKGYDDKRDIFYHEIKDGKHDVATWGKAMPTFLKWGWGIQRDEAY
jgi:enterochelin esterase-like enzyme